MKVALLLALVAAALAQYPPYGGYGGYGGSRGYGYGGRGFGGFGGRGGGSYGGGAISTGYGPPPRPSYGGGAISTGYGPPPRPSYGGGGGSSNAISTGYGPPPRPSYSGGGLVDLSHGYSDYHFSWRHDGGQKYTGDAANYYCTSLGYGWQGVSIETAEEDKLISSIIYKDQLKYIWTSGRRDGYSFRWASGKPFYGLNWSHTGGGGKPQPDNREDGIEDCLAILNDFYQDGIKWHDVACYHEKPIVCERPSTYH